MGKNQFIVLDCRIIDLTSPIVMAIVNVTPDSFFSASRSQDEKTLLNSVEQALNEGATILDVGGCSTRPQLMLATEEDELSRVTWALKLIREHFADIAISIDTFRSSVAERSVVDFGANMINDVSGGEVDAELFSTMARLQVPYVLTHAYGFPNMKQLMPENDDFMPSILRYFAQKTESLRALGFDKEIIIDPGFGFGKSVAQNYQLLQKMSVFEAFNAPILAGVSRKSMITKVLDIKSDEALNGTTAVNMLALVGGARILRVHDVRAAVEATKIFEHTFQLNK